MDHGGADRERRMRALILVLLAAACGCSGCRAPQPAARPFVVSSDGADPCTQACTKIVTNMCDGISSISGCAAACARDQSQGVATQLDPVCIIEAGSIAQLQACGACLTVGEP